MAGGEDLPTGLAGFGQVDVVVFPLKDEAHSPLFQGEYYPYVYYKMNIDMVGAQNSVLGS